MDIKVITRHAPFNYGSLLQSMATLKIVRRLGHKCCIIDYIRDDEYGLKSILMSLDRKKEWNNNFLKKLLYVMLRYPEEYWAQRRFAHMRMKYLEMTLRYRSIAELSTLKADIFMTGSDQVWGPVLTANYDETYFLSFVNNGAKKVSYAASFGKTSFNNQIMSAYRKLLSDYDAITVRENAAVNLLHQMDISCVGQVLDPTLLLTGDEWAEYIDKDISGKYVLVYQLHNNKALNDYAKKLALKLGLPLFRISPSFHQFMRGGKFIYLPKLGKFLSYIKNCSYLVTDSFHGTAFALNFNRQFVEILPNNETGSRNLSILELTGLRDRIVTDFSDFSIAERSIDYDRVNNILNRERKKSIELLGSLCVV